MMSTHDKTIITVENAINAPVEKVWEYWTNPEHIIRWNHASHDWHTPIAENELRAGGRFVFRMEAKDGSVGFDFGGVYDEVRKNEYIEYTMDDGRKVKVTFSEHGKQTKIAEAFEAEEANPVELQQAGWQAILNNFGVYTEVNQ